MSAKTTTDSFEKRLEKLEQLVAQLEQGDISLDESLKAFETGVSLTKSCLATLKNAELKVQQLDNLDVDAELSEVTIADQ
jgi:exodeoxyribonuclease VII small subunit